METLLWVSGSNIPSSLHLENYFHFLEETGKYISHQVP